MNKINKNRSLSRTASRLIGQRMFEILSKTQEIEKTGKRLLHFELGDPDFSAPKNVVQAVYQAMNDGMTHYAPSLGLPIFREAVRDHLEQEFNLHCDHEQVVITPGANSGIYWLMRCLMEEGDEVILPDPGFPSFSAAARAVGARIVPIRLDQVNNFRPDIEQIRASISNKTRLIILNSPSNPIGSILPESDFIEIYKLAEEFDLFILSDDTYRRMIFGNSYPHSVTGIDNCKKRTILLSGLSKEYSLSGFRLGYLVGQHDLIKKIGLYIETVVSCVSPFIQMGGVEALRGDQSERLKNLNELKLRRDNMIGGLNRIAELSCQKVEGGLYVFPNVKNTGLSGDEFSELMLEQAGIVCVPGSAFGEAGTDHVRFSLNADCSVIEMCIDKMISVLGDFKNRFEK
jgi:aspartate aminotransferase